MKRTISLRVWCGLALSVLLAMGGASAPHVKPIPKGPDQELAALQSERASLRGFDDMVLTQLRERRTKAGPSLWTSERLAALPGELGSGWRWEWKPAGASLRRATVCRLEPRLDDWPTHRAAVEAWAARPGVVLDSIEFKAAGRGRNRRFTSVCFTLVFSVAEAAPAEGPPPAAAPVRAALSFSAHPTTGHL